ncbi:unnamed protein product [Vicia faba]|uniref:Uncharacterized protein n=1 Tax=Vicia faba TaxID=3906 RepID=A0AAV0ZZS6_VICFA|nr:unnamed protein product [Vicia faba]
MVYSISLDLIIKNEDILFVIYNTCTIGTNGTNFEKHFARDMDSSSFLQFHLIKIFFSLINRIKHQTTGGIHFPEKFDSIESCYVLVSWRYIASMILLGFQKHKLFVKANMHIDGISC